MTSHLTDICVITNVNISGRQNTSVLIQYATAQGHIFKVQEY